MSDTDLQDRLEGLASTYKLRQDHWDVVIAEADRARDRHRQIASNAARQRADLESVRRGADFLHREIDGGSIFKPTRLIRQAGSRTAREASETLNSHYRHHDDLQAAQKAAIAGLAPSGAAARNVPIVGGKFWTRYQEQVEKGNYRTAERMLKSREGMAKPLMWLLGGGRSVRQWDAHAAQARELAEAHKNRQEEVKTVERAVAKSEKRVARAMAGFLKNADVKTLLAGTQTHNSLDRNIEMLQELHRSGRTDAKSITAYLKANRGAVDLNSVADSFHDLHHKLAIDVRHARQAADITQKRHQAAAELAASCRTARHYETMGSLVDGRFSRNFSADLHRLAGADLSDPAVRAEAERAAAIAFIKGDRWMKPEQAEAFKRDLEMVGQPDFDPDRLQTLPHHHYRRHAVRDSGRRAVEYARDAFRSAVDKVTGDQPAAQAEPAKAKDARASAAFNGEVMPKEPQAAPVDKPRTEAVREARTIDATDIKPKPAKPAAEIVAADPESWLRGAFRMPQKLRVENFGDVRPSQSREFNFHLAGALKEFDKQYEKSFGVTGTEAHERERRRFAQNFTESLLDAYRKDSSTPLELQSESTHSIGNPGTRTTISVKQTSTFNGGLAGIPDAEITSNTGKSHLKWRNDA